jgi:hypothetical protein
MRERDKSLIAFYDYMFICQVLLFCTYVRVQNGFLSFGTESIFSVISLKLVMIGKV